MKCFNCKGPLGKGIKFCSRSCSVSYNNHKSPKRGRHPNHPCEVCGKPTKNLRFCSHLCASEGKYRERVAAWLEGKLEGGSDYATTSFVKRYLCEARSEQCEKCGWSEVNPKTGKVPVQVHHKIAYNDHRPEALELLCPNCHSLTETWGNGNAGHGRPYRPGR